MTNGDISIIACHTLLWFYQNFIVEHACLNIDFQHILFTQISHDVDMFQCGTNRIFKHSIKAQTQS